MQDHDSVWGMNSSFGGRRLVRQKPGVSGVDGGTGCPQTDGSASADIRAAFGPDPHKALQCFVDLGLTNREIARYVGLSETCVTTLTGQLRSAEAGWFS